MDIDASPRPAVSAPFQVPETGVYIVNERGDLALVIEPLAPGLKPTRVRMRGNRLAILSGDTPVAVRGYEERAVEVASKRRETLVFEIDVATRSMTRWSLVPIEDDDGR